MQLDKNKLYYLCHPYTTHGDREKNKQDSIEIENKLKEKYGINILNPLTLINEDDNDKAMYKCLQLLSACNTIILCNNWNMSTGCKQEVELSVNNDIDIVIAKDLLKDGD